MPKTTSSQITSQRVGQAIREARLEARLTQAELARRIDASPAYITNIEAGRANPTVGQLANIATALGADLDVRFRLVRIPTLIVPDQ